GVQVDAPHERRHLIAPPLLPAGVRRGRRAAAPATLPEALDADRVIAPLHARVADQVEVQAVDVVAADDLGGHLGDVAGVVRVTRIERVVVAVPGLALVVEADPARLARGFRAV